jgi:hypothetical protein
MLENCGGWQNGNRNLCPISDLYSSLSLRWCFISRRISISDSFPENNSTQDTIDTAWLVILGFLRRELLSSQPGFRLRAHSMVGWDYTIQKQNTFPSDMNHQLYINIPNIEFIIKID